MIHRLLRLALPLALVLAVPAAQVLLERAVLASTEQFPAALSSHAVLIGAATILFLFLNGPNVYAVAAIARLRRGRPAHATAFAENTVAFSAYSGLLCFLLMPWADVLSTPLLGHSPSEDELNSARFLLGIVAVLLVQYAALAPVLAEERVWAAFLVLASGLLIHAACLFLVPSEWGLSGVTAARAAGVLVSGSVATRVSPIPKAWLGFSPVVRHDKVIQYELLSQGAVVGLHAAVGSLVVGIVFFLALSRNGEAPLSAAAIAFSWYSTLSALPVAVAQAAGIETAEALGQKDSPLLRMAVNTGDRICSHLALTLALGFWIAGSVFWWLIDPVTGSALGMALLGISLHAYVDVRIQAQVWSLRALGRQNGTLVATLVAGLLYAGSLLLIAETCASWFLLLGYDLLLYVLLRRILARSVPVQPSHGGMNKWGTSVSRLVSPDSGRAAFDSARDQ
jgi:Na+-driven multidrug efflux pump